MAQQLQAPGAAGAVRRLLQEPAPLTYAMWVLGAKKKARMAEHPEAAGAAGAADGTGAEHEGGTPSLGGVVSGMVARLSATDADRRGRAHAQPCRARSHAQRWCCQEGLACLLS